VTIARNFIVAQRGERGPGRRGGGARGYPLKFPQKSSKNLVIKMQ